MTDGFGREIDYIRISVTEQCSLRCIYCMPEELLPEASEDFLTWQEIRRLAEVCASLGIKKIRLTGGEPLIRRDLPRLISSLKETKGIEQVTVTTNGVGLAKQMPALAEAGIDGINLSLDTLNPEVYAQITRRRMLPQVMEGLDAALGYPEISLKINCVPLGIPGQDVTALAGLARRHLVHVRYIELMPMGLGAEFGQRIEARRSGAEAFTETEILEKLAERYGSYRPCEERLGNGPGRYVAFPGFSGRIGFISALSHRFCSSCNRVRLTSRGFLKPCLQYDTGADLRPLLREGGSDEALRNTVRRAILEKPEGHTFMEKTGEHRETRLMSQIGG